MATKLEVEVICSSCNSRDNLKVEMKESHKVIEWVCPYCNTKKKVSLTTQGDKPTTERAFPIGGVN